MATRNAINVLIKLLGGDKMVAELEKLGKTGEKAFKEIEGSANKVNLARLGGALNAFGKDFATVASRASLAFTGLVAGAVAAAPAVIALANAGADAADKVGKAAQATGLQTDAYQKLAFAAEQAGTGQEQFATAMSKFNREIVETADKAGKAVTKMGRDIRQGVGFTVEAFDGIGVEVTRFGDEVEKSGKKAAKGAKETQTAFQQLGIKVRDASGRLKTTEQLLLEVAEAFQRMPDGARKSAIAVALFGQAGAKLIPFLNQGAEGIRELGEEAEALGLIFTKDQIAAAQSYNDALGSLRRTATALRNQIGLIFVPALTQAARAFRDAILRNRDAILSFANGAVKTATVLVKDLILALAGGQDANVENTWIIEWRDAIIQFGNDVVAVVNGVVIPAFSLLRETITLVTDTLNEFFGTDISAGQVLIGAALIKLVGGFRLLRSTIVLAVEAIAFFSRALLANPYIAAIAAVGVGIGLWATRTDSASAALEEHQGLVDKVKGAYDAAGGSVKNMTDEIRNGLILETRDALKDLVPAFEAEMERLRDAAAAPARENPFSQALRDFANGGDLQAYLDAVKQIGAANPELTDAAVAFLEMTTKAQELNTQIVPLTTYLNDLTSAAANTPEIAAPLNDTAEAAGTAAEKVQELGRQITVTSFGEAGMSKQVFDVVDGIAKRAEQGKASLDGLGQSASQAGQAVQGVSNEITNSVRDAVPPDAVAPAVDQVISDVDRIAPAAQQTAADANAALSDIGNINASGAEQAAQAIVQPFEGLQSKITTIFAGIRTVAQSGFSSIAALVRQLASQIEAEINRIIAALRRAAAEAARLRAQAARSSSSSSSSGSGGSQGGFAQGGRLHGPGTKTSDSILMWGSVGEYMIRAAAVDKYGPGLFAALNSMRLPKDFLKSLRGFNLGGIIDGVSRSMSIPRLAGGGSVGNLMPAGVGASGSSVTLVIDRQQFGPLWGPAETISALTRFARSDAMQSAGRKPGRK